MNYTVKFHPAAERDLDDLLTHLAQEAGATVANRFVDRIVDYRLGFSTFPERGMRHDDVAKGLRTVGWRRRATIAFTVRQDTVGFSMPAGRWSYRRTTNDIQGLDATRKAHRAQPSLSSPRLNPIATL